MREKFIVQASDGIKLNGIKSIPTHPIATIVINHGFAEHVARYDYVANKLADAGYACYYYDLRGHGNSGGERGDIVKYSDFVDDANLIVKKAKEELPNKPLYMLGHSMGGFISVLYALKYKDSLNGQILSAAATIYPLQTNAFLRSFIKIASKLMPKFKIASDLSSLVSRDQEIVKTYKSDPLVLKKATLRFYNQFLIEGMSYLKNNVSAYNYDCLILHGEDDKIISCEASKNLYKNIASSKKEIKIYPKLYHEIFNEPEKDEVINDLVFWLNSRS